MISLKASRVNVNLTIEQASKLLGIHPATLSRWENKWIKVPEIAKAKICEVYQINQEQIDWSK